MLITTGAKSYVFEAKLNRQTIRRTIGDVRAWSIEDARVEANRVRVVVDSGADPRELERQQQAATAARKAAATAEATTMQEAWDAYLAARKDRWGTHHYRDHVAKAKAGGDKAKRGTRGRGVTIAGPLHSLMGLKLRDLPATVIGAWAAEEAKTRPTAARLAWRLLKSFLSWCSEQPKYAAVLPLQNPAKTKAVREVLGKAKVKQDVLQREQLPVWFAAVRQLWNATAAVFLQILLLTGARPGEVLSLRWEDVNAKWKGLTIRDKVEGERVIPLTPYVAHLLDALPVVNDWVFASPARDEELADKAMSKPHNPHKTACGAAGL
jgi:integrase